MIERIVGVLLAAGRGRRMGGTKQLLPWVTDDGETTLVAAAFDAILAVCDRIVVVVGHEAEAIRAALGDRSFDAVEGDPDAEMLDSIRRGLAAAARIDPEADVLLHPADHPVVAPATVKALLEARREHPGRAVIPTWQGRGGHPVIMPAEVVAKAIGFTGEGGLRRFWIEHAELCARIPVDDPWVVKDLDTIEQYRSAGGPGRDHSSS